MMCFLSRAVEIAEEVVCVSVLAAVLGADVEQAEPRVEDVVDAVQDYHDQTRDSSTETWIARLLYSDRILRWLGGRIISVAREQGAFDHVRTVRQADESGNR